jgi:hypothetical protein
VTSQTSYGLYHSEIIIRLPASASNIYQKASFPKNMRGREGMGGSFYEDKVAAA